VLGTSDQCIATYPGDFAQALIALDATVEIAGKSGTRTLPFAQLHKPPGATPHIETILARAFAQRVQHGGTCIEAERSAFAVDAQGYIDRQGGILGRFRRIGGDASAPCREWRCQGGSGRRGDECAAIEPGPRIGMIGHGRPPPLMGTGARLRLDR
jgi:CO/xanthine dehydrogenase FAD-binding subunit